MARVNLELNAKEAPIVIYALGRCHHIPEAWLIAKRLIELLVPLPPAPGMAELPTGARSDPPANSESEK